MRLRPARLLPTLVVLIAATTPAVANAAKAPAKKPTCNLIVSPKSGGMIAGDLAPELDILSGDIATGKSEVGATLRLASVDWAANNFSKIGERWVFRFSVKGATYVFELRHNGTAAKDTASFKKDGSEVAVPAVTIDPKAKAIIWKVPRKHVTGLAKQSIREIGASTFYYSVSQDGADSKAAYPDQWPSCLKVK